jgi:hypothetical protein
MPSYPSILNAQDLELGTQMVVPYQIGVDIYHQARPHYIHLEKNMYKNVTLRGEADMIYKGVIVGFDYNSLNYIINFIYQDENNHKVPGLWLVHPENPGLEILQEDDADDELYNYVAARAGIAFARANDPNAKPDFKVQGLTKKSGLNRLFGKKPDDGPRKPALQGPTADIMEAINRKRASSKAEGKTRRTRRRGNKGKKTKRR